MIASSTSLKGDGVSGGGAGAAILAGIIVSLIYFGRDVFIPIALAILLSFVLAPIVRTLQDWHIPRGFSIITVVVLAFLAMFVVGGIIAVQITQLAGDLPHYQSTIHVKIESLRARRTTSGRSNAPRKSLRSLAERSISPLMQTLMPRR